MAAHLPASLQYRLHRLVGLANPDMQAIERDYPAWIERFDRIDIRMERRIRQEIARIDKPPLISVLMPVYNSTPDHLIAAIKSVREQFYPTWELCIADDASTDPAIGIILHEAAAGDPRIKFICRERNGHISAASNAALKLATGAFVALLDHDDILPRHALHEVASRIIAQPDVDIIYSDEDHIDNDGRRSHPYFKPDWNPDLMLGQNLISHLGVYRRSLMEKVGGFRIGFEGSQDHDLALRIVAETTSDRIAHIAKVLYHWRQGAGDRTFSEAAQARCVLNGRRAVEDFVHRLQPVARVEPAPLVTSWARVVYPVAQPQPLVSVILCPAKAAETARCLDRLTGQTAYTALEILSPATPAIPAPAAPDDVSPQRTPVALNLNEGAVSREQPSLKAMIDRAKGDLLLFLDPALEPADPEWLTELVSHALRPEIGAVGAKLLNPQGAILHAGVVVCGRNVAFTPFVGRDGKHVGYFGHLQLARDVTAVSGGCLLVRRQAFLNAGGFDEALTPVFADIDLCLKLQDLGLRNLWTPFAELVRSDTSAQRRPIDMDVVRQAAAAMRERWGRRLLSDPCWNPNLSTDPHEMALAFPPQQNLGPVLKAA